MRRFEGQACSGVSAALAGAAPPDVGAIVELDRRAFGTRRGFLMQNFLARAGTRAFVHENGFVIRRRGLRADQVGPVVAADERTAAGLLVAALDAAPGPVFLDVTDGRPLLNRILTDRRFSVQRSFTRMALGRTEPFGDRERLFVVAGPEFG
jgi:hypothetical protein